MRRAAVIAILVAAFTAGLVASSSAERRIVDGLELTFNADFTPEALPREHPAPVTVEVDGKIATTDGSHPPPLRYLEIEINRSGRLDAKGLPTCTAPVLQSTSTEAAMERCGPALVGRGRFRADVLLGKEVAASGTILAFNSRSHGKRALVIHLFAAVPVRFTLVAPLTIGHRRSGNFGTVLRAPIPRLGGGLGSITEIDLAIGRRYSFRGKRHSYVSAACAAPANFSRVPFPFARGTFRFEGHKTITETLSRTCRVR